MPVLITILVFIIIILVANPLFQLHPPIGIKWSDAINIISGISGLGSFIAALWVIRTSEETTKLSVETFNILKTANDLLTEAKNKAEVLVAFDYKPHFSFSFEPQITFQNQKINSISWSLSMQNQSTKTLEISQVGFLISINNVNLSQELPIAQNVFLNPGHCLNKSNTLESLFDCKSMEITAFADYFDPFEQQSKRYFFNTFDIQPETSISTFRENREPVKILNKVTNNV